MYSDGKRLVSDRRLTFVQLFVSSFKGPAPLGSTAHSENSRTDRVTGKPFSATEPVQHCRGVSG